MVRSFASLALAMAIRATCESCPESLATKKLEIQERELSLQALQTDIQEVLANHSRLQVQADEADEILRVNLGDIRAASLVRGMEHAEYNAELKNLTSIESPREEVEAHELTNSHAYDALLQDIHAQSVDAARGRDAALQSIGSLSRSSPWLIGAALESTDSLSRLLELVSTASARDRDAALESIGALASLLELVSARQQVIDDGFADVRAASVVRGMDQATYLMSNQSLLWKSIAGDADIREAAARREYDALMQNITAETALARRKHDDAVTGIGAALSKFKVLDAALHEIICKITASRDQLEALLASCAVV